MEISAEMTLREKVMKYVKQYVLITLSISIMSVGVYFFKFPNNFVFGGVTGTAALVAKLTPMSASAFSSAANLVLLVVGLSMLVCTVLGGIIGVLLPFVARRIGTDPATLSSPLITSIMDLVGVFIYFAFAYAFLGDLLQQAG